jgi:hypothetical protein
MIGVEVASTIRSMDRHRFPHEQGRPSRRRGEIGGRLAGCRDMALADAGALGDPFVRGLEAAGQLGIGHHRLRPISAAGNHLGTHDH